MNRPTTRPSPSPLAPPWSAWQPLAGVPPQSSDVLAETLDGGQSFRWHRQPDDTWLGVWADNVVRLRLEVGTPLRGVRGRLGETSPPLRGIEWSAPAALAPRTAAELARYFALDRDFAALADTLPWRSDPHLARCVEAFRGLRILRQPFGETLLGFLCSATKQIVQIKQMLALLAERHGAAIAGAAKRVSVSPGGENPTVSAPPACHRLPTWPELAAIPEAGLRACLLGFRAKYIAGTAQFLAAHPGWLEETESLPYPAAKERLCSLPGVGEKVADCVLLFGAGRLEAFPVDVWILKTMAHRYGLTGWRPAQLAQFGRAHFGPLAGLAQQFLFAWERRLGRTAGL